jgi:DNA-binding protein HU-beta
MSKIVNKVDLTKDVSDIVDLPQVTVKKVIDAVWDIIKQKLVEGDQVSIVGFGNFSVKNRAARVGRNPKTGESIQINAARIPGFKAGKVLKDALKENK